MLDPTYGTGGVASYPADSMGTGTVVRSIGGAGILQPDGRLVLAGTGAGGAFAAVRLNTDGSIDTAFGQGGTALVPITVNGLTLDTASGVVVQPDGRILLSGSVATGFISQPHLGTQFLTEGAVIRLNPDGTVDTAYGGPSSNGSVLITPDPANPSMTGNTQILGAALQPDGKLMLWGTNAVPADFFTRGTPTLYRLNPDGTVDTAFGQEGRAGAALGGPVALQPDGKIVVAGSVTLDPLGYVSRSQFAAQRLDPDGSPDPSFGNTGTPGLAQYNFGARNINSQASALAIQADGNILLVGGTTTFAGTFLPIDFQPAASRVLARPSGGPGVLPPPPTPPASFDGLGRTDLAVYLTSTGVLAYRPQTQFFPDNETPFGIPGPGQTLPAAADYFGTGRTLVAAYLPSQGLYAIRPPVGPDVVIPFGVAGKGQTIPAPADYEGTGRADIAVYLPMQGVFGIRPSTGGPDRIVPFGIAGPGQSIPAPGDYEGTGRADIAVYLPALGAFAIRPSTGGPDRIIPFGVPGPGRSIPVPGDYDGSGRTELAVYIPSQGVFAYRPAGGGPDVIVPFGAPGDGSIPVPGDYSGSGRTEIALFDPTSGAFAYRPGNGGPDVITAFGASGVGASLPVAAPSGVVPKAPARAPSMASAPAPSGLTVTARAPAVPGGPLAAASARKASKVSVLQVRPAGQNPERGVAASG